MREGFLRGGCEGKHSRVGGVDVRRGEDGPEAVALEDAAAFFVVGACDEDGLVAEAGGAREEVAEGGVGLDEGRGGEGDVEAGGEVAHALGFGFAAAVGEEDEGDVGGLEEAEGGGRAGDGVGHVQEDAVDAVEVLAGWIGARGRGNQLEGKGK